MVGNSFESFSINRNLILSYVFDRCQQNKKRVFCYTFGMYSNKTVAIPTSMTYVRRNKAINVVPYESVRSYIGLFTTKKGSFVVPLVCTQTKLLPYQQA